MENNVTEKDLMQEPEKVFTLIDQDKIDNLKKNYETTALDLRKKEYALEITDEQLHFLKTYMTETVSWKGKEALGVIEILKTVKRSEEEGINDGVVYFKNLEVEASHYFLNKYEGKGENNAELVKTLLDSLERTLSLIGEDNKELKDLELKIKAAQQGIEAE